MQLFNYCFLLQMFFIAHIWAQIGKKKHNNQSSYRIVVLTQLETIVKW